MSQISIAILTPQQRKDLVRALISAIDASDDDAQVNRWVELINLIQKEDAA